MKNVQDYVLIPVSLVNNNFKEFRFFISLEILIDDSIKKTFSVISFMRPDHIVQKVANKEVRFFK